MSLTSPAVTWTAVESSLKTLLHEWLTAYFNGGSHVIFQAVAEPFPLVAVAFSGPVTQPLLRSLPLALRRRTSGTAYLTTAEAHGLTTGDRVRLSGVSTLDDSYDAAVPKAVTVISPTQFSVTNSRYDEAETDASGAVWVGPEAEIRVVVHPGRKRRHQAAPLAGAASGLPVSVEIQHSVLLDFWVRAAVSSGQGTLPAAGGNAESVGQYVADRLQALIESPIARLDLANKGVAHLEARLQQVVPQAEHNARVVSARADLRYTAG